MDVHSASCIAVIVKKKTFDIATTNQDQLRQTMNRTPSSSARGAHKQQKKGEERSSGAGELRREKTSMGGEKTWRLFT
jgi:hypothetical protein